uniref:Uncharacterized protein n=1 Tax=Romanomermis culicivorax TaxID=13658 RepID=A0A915JCB4_ROMCU
MNFGNELGILDHLDICPRSSEYIAFESSYKQNYVAAWLKIMVEAGLVENTDSENLFRVNPDHRNVMVKTNPTILLSGLLTMVLGIASKIKACFRLDGPSGTEYSDYENLRSSNAITDNSSKQNVIKILHGIPPSLKFKLASGHASYLDVGCGLGIQTSILSK